MRFSPFFPQKLNITGFALYFLKHVEISLVTSLYFLSAKKKFKKNNFFFEFGGAKTLDVRLSVRNALFLLRTWDPANFWCVYTEFNSKNNESDQKLLGLLFGEIGS